MMIAMLPTSLKRLAVGVLAVLTSWRFCARACTCLQFPRLCRGRGGGGHVEPFKESTARRHHADLGPMGGHRC